MNEVTITILLCDDKATAEANQSNSTQVLDKLAQPSPAKDVTMMQCILCHVFEA
jgi:hypothetical protein